MWRFLAVGYRHQSTSYVLDAQNPNGVESGVLWLELDGKRLRTKVLSLVDDGIEHRVVVRMGHVEKKAKSEENGLNESGNGESATHAIEVVSGVTNDVAPG